MPPVAVTDNGDPNNVDIVLIRSIRKDISNYAHLKRVF